MFAVQGVAYFAKIAIHPEEVTGLLEYIDRAHVGPIPGWLAFATGLAFHSTWILIAWLTLRDERADTSVVADVLD